MVDITSTGATLAANGLKVLADGVILRSQAQLAASLRATWTPAQLAAAERLLRAVEARAAALGRATLSWPAGEAREAGMREKSVVDRLVAEGASRRPDGLLVDEAVIREHAAALTQAGLGPVAVSRPDHVFEVTCASFIELKGAISDILIKK